MGGQTLPFVQPTATNTKTTTKRRVVAAQGTSLVGASKRCVVNDLFTISSFGFAIVAPL